MRMLLSLGGLLLVLWVVSQLAGTQRQALAPPGESGAASAGVASAPGSAASAVSAQLIQAVQQGAAQRAEVAASQ